MSAELRSLIELASWKIEKIFRIRGEILAMWHYVKADGEHVIMPPPAVDKDISCTLMRVLFEIDNVVRYLFIDEAWMAHIEDDAKLADWLKSGHPVRAHPKRREIVVFAGEDSESAMQAHRDIIRPQHGKPHLGPLVFDHFTESQGRLIGMLPRKGALQ